MELLIFINSAGPNINFVNVQDTLKSFQDNINIENYGFYYVTDTNSNANEILKIFKNLNLESKIVDFKINNLSWANNFNIFFDTYKNKTKYFAYSHDDLKIKTFNFFNLMLKNINTLTEKIGWITFTSDGYYNQFNNPISNSFREGFALDRNNYPRIAECHKFADGTQYSPEFLDYPHTIVKCHAPFPHLVFISNDALTDIGYCSDWSLYTLLIDEDWGMEALKKNYNNVWIPDIVYTHPLRPAERKFQGLRYEQQVHKHFSNKWEWDFGLGNYSDQFIDYICNKYANTNIPMSKGKNSFDWQYII